MNKLNVWFDVETSGVSAETDHLLEVACVLTDSKGDFVSEPYCSLLTIKDVNKVMMECDTNVREMHEKSGLWSDLWSEQTKTAEVIDVELQAQLDLFPDDCFILGGNSPFLDRRFAQLYFPGFYKRLSHRTMDNTSLSMFLNELKNFPEPIFEKRKEHRALPDVLDSVEEFRFYLDLMD